MSAAIIVVVGGFGKQVGIKVRQLVRTAVASAGDVEAAREMERQIHVIAVDAFAQPDHDEFGAGGALIMPRNPYFVDQQVGSLWAGQGDAFFREWYPAEHGVPVRIGDFDHGDGRNRLKSKTGYRLALTEPNGNLADHVMARVQRINNALGPAAHQDDTRIPVYVVASLGGGAGSGKALVIGQHLRSVLPGTCKLVGVFALPDVTEKLVSAAERPFVWANSWAALAELDHFQLPVHIRSHPLTPFLRWPAVNGEIPGDQPPFEYTYLFGARSQAGTFLPTYPDYIRLVAECLATEVFSPIANNIADPHAQFVQAIGDLPVHNGRPWSYASAGVASLVYPVDRVEMHLARRWLADATRMHLLPADVDERSATIAGRKTADRLLEDVRIVPLEALIAHLDATWAGEQPLPPIKPLKADEGAFAEADREVATRVVRDRVETLDRWMSERYRPHLRTHGSLVLKRARGGDEGLSCDPNSLASAIETELRAGSVEALLRARGMSMQFRQVMEEAFAKAMAELHGPRWQTHLDDGVTGASKTHRAALPRQITVLRDGFGPLSRRGRNAKQTFVRQWWDPHLRRERRLAQLQTAVAIYGELRTIALHLEQAMERLFDQIALIAAEASETADRDLGARTQGAVLEEGVLAEKELVEAYFADELATAILTRGDELANRLLGGRDGETGLRRLFTDLVTRAGRGTPLPEDHLAKARLRTMVDAVADGERLFAEAVRRPSVWEAASIECDLRQRLGLIDIPLQKALQSGDRRAAALLDEGHADAGMDAHLRQRFIEEKLDVTARRATPFWSLDVAVGRDHDGVVPGRPFQVTVLACDRTAYEVFLTQSGHPDFLPGIEGRLGVQRSDRPGRHGVSIYARQGGVPLFYLDQSMRRGMRDAAKQIGRTHHLFTDRRFPTAVSGDMNPPLPLDQQARLTLASATHFGLIEFQPDQTVFRLNGTPAVNPATSVVELHQGLIDDPGFLTALNGRVTACFAALPESDRATALQRIAAGAKARGNTADPVDRQWWEGTAGLIARSTRNGH